MLPALLILAVVALLLLAWALAPRGVAWAGSLTRLNAGSRGRGEWMAPPEVVRAVKRDYLSTQDWLAGCAADWGRLARELEQHAAGPYLERQHQALAALVQARGPRLALSLRAQHELAVRRFTPDGLRCLLIDRQSEVTGAASDFWTGRPAGRQRLRQVTLVMQMVYDQQHRRWKTEQVIQALPHPDPAGVSLMLAGELPVAGRDY
jgi:hypothetical protein